MDQYKIIFDLGIVLIGALIGGSIVRKLKLPSVIGFILVGMMLSPYTPGIVIEREELKLFADLGAILIMFVTGLQFKYSHFKQFGVRAFVTASVACAATFFAGILGGAFLGMNGVQSLIIGALFVSTSTTIALGILQDMGVKNDQSLRIIRASVVIDDLFGFIALAVVHAYIGASTLSASDVVGLSLVMIGSFITIFLLGVYVTPPIFEFVEKVFPHSAFSFGVAFCLLLTYGMLQFNISPYIGAFLAGTILTSTIRYRNVLQSTIPLRNLFGSIFFVSIGMMVDPRIVMSVIPLAMVLTLFAVISKGIAAAVMLVHYGAPLRDAIPLGFVTGPRGEVLLIIAESVVVAGLVEASYIAIATGIVFLTALITPLIIGISKCAVKSEC